MKPPIDFSPIVQRACRFLKIGSRNESNTGEGTESPRRKRYKGISFSNDVYQETCQPIVRTNPIEESSSRRSSVVSSHRNSASNFTEEKFRSTSPRSSIRMYDYPWGRGVTRKTSKHHDYQDVEELSENPKMEEGIYNFELIKPPNGYLGLVLVGGTDTPLQKHYIKDILPNSTASRDGRVKIGDELIEVNGHSLRGRTHSLALAVIHSLPPVIRLVIERSKDGNKTIISRCLYQGDFQEEPRPDPHITSPKDRSNRRSILERANESSVINKSVNTVINIQRSASTVSIKPVKLVRRESRCTSFIVGDDDSDDDEDDVMAFECDDVQSVKEGVMSEETGSDCDDRLSMLSNTSEWCAKQMMNCRQEEPVVPSLPDNSDNYTDTTSVFSMSTLSDSLPSTYDECRSECSMDQQTTLSRHGSIRGSRRLYTESIIEVGSDEEEERVPEDPPMFLRHGSLRVRGSMSLRGAVCEESEEERATWPTTVRRQRTSLNWDTFVPPPNSTLRRSSSACVRRPSSMCLSDYGSSRTRTKASREVVNSSNSRKLQRTNSGRYIDKKTFTTKVYRIPTTGEWGFTIAGGAFSPYGDLPIHVLSIKDSMFTGSLKSGDEIVSFGGENFSNVMHLEAERKMKNFETNCATVIIKRKFLQRRKSQVLASYAEAWNEQARTARRERNRPESLYC